MISGFVKKESSIYFGSLFVLFCLAMLAVIPVFRAFSFYNYLWTFGIITYLGLIFLEDSLYLLFTNKFRRLIFIYIIYTISVPYLFGNNDIGNRFLELSQLPLFYIGYHFNKSKGNNKYNVKIVQYLVPFILVISVITVLEYKTNPLVSRGLKSSQGEGLDTLLKGVGGYDFIYFLVFFIMVLLFCKQMILIKKKTIHIIAYYAIIFLFMYNIVLSNFSTALFLILFGVTIRFLGKKISISKLIFLLIVFLFLYISSDIIIESLANFYLSNFGDNLNAKRVIELRNLALNDTLGDSITERSLAYKKSIEVFFNYPFMGSIQETLSRNSSGKLNSFGQHSQILDTFALFGLVIGVIQIYIYLKPIIIRLFIGRYLNSLSVTILVSFLIISVFNNVTPSIGLAVFFVYPTFNEFLISKK